MSGELKAKDILLERAEGQVRERQVRGTEEITKQLFEESNPPKGKEEPTGQLFQENNDDVYMADNETHKRGVREAMRSRKGKGKARQVDEDEEMENNDIGVENEEIHEEIHEEEDDDSEDDDFEDDEFEVATVRHLYYT
jgi:hypothetical protein